MAPACRQRLRLFALAISSDPSRVTRLTDALDAAAALTLKLDAEDIKTLEEPYKPKRVMGHV